MKHLKGLEHESLCFMTINVGAFGNTNLTVTTDEQSHFLVVAPRVFKIYASVIMGISACNLISYSFCPLLVSETYAAHIK